MPTPSPTFMMVTVTVLWGLSFPLMKEWQDASRGCPGGPKLASLTMIALRMILALLVLYLFQPRLFRGASRREHASGMAVGLVFFAGFTLQVIGLAYTTPALSAFLTSLASAWVPILGLWWFGARLSWLTGVGLLLGIGGVLVLSGVDRETGWSLGRGEALTLAASVLFAVQIILLDRLGKQVTSAHLTVGMLGLAGVLALGFAVAWAAAGEGVVAWLEWTASMLSRPSILFQLGLLTILCTVLSFHWMNIYQPKLSAARAALIYLLEPVSASLFSILLGYDDPTLRLLLGGVLVLGGNLLAEMPGWFQNEAGATRATERNASM